MQPTLPLLRALRRLQLTTKNGPEKGYYKGTGTGRMGRWNRRGEYLIDFNLVRTYMAPGFDEAFSLTPFVAKTVARPLFDPWYRDREYEGPGDVRLHLQKWKDEGAWN